MKLYIATCTLNFNNIMSSESISPLGFYAKRGFGSKRFYPVCANDKEQVILLYDKYPRFKVVENDIENYPMVIEIESADYKKGFFEKAMEYEGIKTYLCYHTINLNPFHCRFYFNTDLERQSILSKAEQSLENKFSKLYAANMQVKCVAEKANTCIEDSLFTESEYDDFLWNPSFARCKVRDVSIDIGKDVLQDRVKGFIYCYLIGANSSISKEVAYLKALYKKLHNTLSAVVNSPDKRPTRVQKDAINNGIREFNEIYSSIDEAAIESDKHLESILQNLKLSISVRQAKCLFSAAKVYDDFNINNHLRIVYDANDLLSCLEDASLKAFTRVTDRMEDALRELEAKDIDQREKPAIESLLNVEDNFDLHILDESYQTSFYERLICSQFRGDYKSVMDEKCVGESLAQAYNGGTILKNMLGDKKWESEPVATYVRALLDHFQENSAFNLFDTFDAMDVLPSFAAFCQKGDNIDRLTEYLVQMGFPNKKLAFGIYGATRGFASLPKTFTSVLINGNKNYYQSFASSLWRMLNGVEIKDTDLSEASTNASIVNQIIKRINIVEPTVKNQQRVVGAITKASELEDAVQSPKAFMYILDSFPHIKKSNVFKALNAANFAEDNGRYTPDQFRKKIYSIVGEEALKSQKKSIDTAIKLEEKRQDPEAFLSILDNYLKPSSAPYEKIKALLISSTSFINDKNCWAFLRQRIPIFLRDNVYSDLRLFQDKYKKGDAKASCDNRAYIEAFVRFLGKKYSSQVRIEQIREDLEEIYVK